MKSRKTRNPSVWVDAMPVDVPEGYVERTCALRNSHVGLFHATGPEGVGASGVPRSEEGKKKEDREREREKKKKRKGK